MKRTASAVYMIIIFAIAANAQTTAFTYQGSLKDNAAAANGNYDFEFALYDVLSGGSQLGSTIQKNMVSVANGIFSVKLDFGSVFPGANRYLEVRVRLTGQPGLTTLVPRQAVTAAPYSITSGDATSPNIARLTVPNTAMAATGTPTVNSGFITSAAVTSAGSGYGTPPTVTVNDATGSGAVVTANISSGSVTSLTVQNPGSNYSAGATLTIASPQSNAFQTFVTPNFFTGVNTMNNVNNTFTGNGAGLTALNAANLTSGTVVDARLSSNVAFRDAQNTFSAAQNTFSGKVGIGTTGPVAPLEVVGDWNNVDGALRLTGDRPTLRMTGGAAAGNQSWILHLGSNGPGNLEFYRTCGIGCWQQSLAMTTTGKVGINVTPSYGLHVVSADNTGLRVQTNSTGGTIASFGGNGEFQIDAPSVTGGRFIVKENGRVGIGTASPTNTLHVIGGITASSGIAVGGTISTPGHTHTGTLEIDTLFAGGTTLCRNATGSVSNCSSSIRYKTDIEPFTAGLDMINRLRPVSYLWKIDRYRDLGFIAEEVERIEPLLTFQNKQGQVEGVKYEKLAVLFVNAFKEQQSQIEYQKQQLAKQQQEIDALKALVCQQNFVAQICREDK